MGNSSSKAAQHAGKAAAAAGRRQYPSTSSILNSAPSTSSAPSYQKPPAETNQVPDSERPFSPSQVHPDPNKAPATENKNPQVELDGRDPQFGAALRRLGPAVPASQSSSDSHTGPQVAGGFPTSSQPPLGQQGRNIFPNSASASNPSLMIVSARKDILAQYESETENLGRSSFAGKTLLTAREISEIIRMKMSGKGDAEIEKTMRLKPGIVKGMGAGTVVNNV